MTSLQQLLISLSTAAFLSGCALAPGSFMEADESSPELEGQVAFYSITPDVIAANKGAFTELPALADNATFEEERANYDYRVGRGDVLSITVWDHPELTIPA